MSEKIPLAPHEAPQRHTMRQRLLRQTNRLPPIDRWHQSRAEWMIEKSQIQHFLAPRVPWVDARDKRKGVKEGMGGVRIACIGAGKGYEVDEIDQMLPRSEIHAIDPHDYFSPPVEKRANTLSHRTEYLSEKNRAEQMEDLADKSMDGVAFYFSLHHMNDRHLPIVMREIHRILKDDGYAFVVEDLADSEEEKKRVEEIDRRINLETDVQGHHHYKSRQEWEEFFGAHGLKVVDFKEEKPNKVRHGFFVLQKIKDTKAK